MFTAELRAQLDDRCSLSMDHDFKTTGIKYKEILWGFQKGKEFRAMQNNNEIREVEESSQL